MITIQTIFISEIRMIGKQQKTVTQVVVEVHQERVGLKKKLNKIYKI